jgi:hypothetical protein
MAFAEARCAEGKRALETPEIRREWFAKAAHKTGRMADSFQTSRGREGGGGHCCSRKVGYCEEGIRIEDVGFEEPL